MPANDSLTPKQEKLMLLLVGGKSIVEAAALTSVSEKTAHRWLGQPTFQRAYDAARKRVVNQAIATLQTKFGKAIGTLDRHMDAAKTISRDQIRAAEVVVEKTIQTAQLLERIAELEAELAAKEQDMQNFVVFDLRLLTKDERAMLRAIDANLTARQQDNAY
jgi:hypothetical protein